MRIREIASEPGYTVDEYGVVRNKSNIPMKLVKTRDGYLKVKIRHKNGKTYLVHRLVASAFIDNPLNKPTVNHINGIKDDNRVQNLEWATHKEQSLHARSTGLNKGRKSKRVMIEKDGITFVFESPKKAAEYIGSTVHAVHLTANPNQVQTNVNGWKCQYV